MRTSTPARIVGLSRVALRVPWLVPARDLGALHEGRVQEATGDHQAPAHCDQGIGHDQPADRLGARVRQRVVARLDLGVIVGGRVGVRLGGVVLTVGVTGVGGRVACIVAGIAGLGLAEGAARGVTGRIAVARGIYGIERVALGEPREPRR